jgi:hypothetical protein
MEHYVREPDGYQTNCFCPGSLNPISSYANGEEIQVNPITASILFLPRG